MVDHIARAKPCNVLLRLIVKVTNVYKYSRCSPWFVWFFPSLRFLCFSGETDFFKLLVPTIKSLCTVSHIPLDIPIACTGSGH
jgi:hypothetical protein